MDSAVSGSAYNDPLTHFINELRTDTYPFLGESYPEDWGSGNTPTSTVWDDSSEHTLAIYWLDDMTIRYSSEEIQGKLRSVQKEWDNNSDSRGYSDKYPCGLLMAVAFNVEYVIDLAKVDPELASAPDIVILALLHDKIYKLDLAKS